ncbi:tyrosine-type recombinase/integrase [Microbacterium aerolatum]|uniref:Tyr recombinase domain-containing protein n=1 Tax=Microbacterium aerolatum TaxID=153731 RepID=A0A511AKW4_9MICO|nr:tyrosine-type recombinase/integrase [Microbacterium aerolatum]GEK87481.1 hypothetical protein MAE01_26570 [Microbacterium aerolatum]GGB23771.1 hypothetical protein GCM10007198_12690 [Microbacterium aerolatum]
MDAAGIENVTPHRFRRTVATGVNDAQDALPASELLGHTDPRITMQHYIQRSEIVNPVTASTSSGPLVRLDDGKTMPAEGSRVGILDAHRADPYGKTSVIGPPVTPGSRTSTGL